MEFAILGPLRMTENGHSYAPSAPKQRQLLALLLLHADQAVSASTCIDELWEEAPPARAQATLQSHVLQLRRTLSRIPGIGSAQAARRVLQTRDGGYALVIGDGELDVRAFTSLVREGRAQLRHDDHLASALLARALGLWQGSALSQVRSGPVLRARVAGLEAERLSVCEQRIDADLRLGRHRELLGELSTLVATHPTHENLHAQLMLALHRSGRRAEALDVARRLYRVLHDQLGVEPSPAIRALQQAVLACSPDLDRPADTCCAPAPRPARRPSATLVPGPRPAPVCVTHD